MTSIKRFGVEYQEYHNITRQRRGEQLRALHLLCKSSNVEEPQNCTPEQFNSWLQGLSADRQPSTVRWYAKLVLPFFGWAFDVGLYDAEDLMRIKRVPLPKAPRRPPRPYSSKEIKKLWPAIEKAHPLEVDPKFIVRYQKKTSKFGRIEHHANNLQLNALSRLALDGGLRRGELYALSLDDMHYDNAYIVVREGKGDKFREVPYTEAAKEAVRLWIEMRTRLKPKHKHPWLALTRIGPRGVEVRPMRFERFAMYVKDAGPKWELHRLRHTCATTWLRAGMPIEKVSRLLGHANLQQTMAYVELVPDDIQREVERHEEAFQEQVA